MSIVASELIAYGATSRPVDDTSTTGGTLDTAYRPVFTQLAANSTVRLVSSSASDVTPLRIRVIGRDATGTVVTEDKVLTGTTAVTTTATFERIQSIEIRNATVPATAVGTITVTNSGNTVTYGTVPIGEKGFYCMFQNASSTASQTIRYEKFFWYNANTTTTLNSAAVKITSGGDPSAVIRIGLSTALSDVTNGQDSAANRLTTPTAGGTITFVDDNVSQNVPGGTLPSLKGIGVWVELTLAANNSPLKSTFTTQLSGTTT
jgi:hypothetical protein